VARDPSAISAFEFQFDKSDTDTSRVGEATPYGTLAKTNGSTCSVVNGLPKATAKGWQDRHLDAVAGCAWTQKQYHDKSIDNGWKVCRILLEPLQDRQRSRLGRALGADLVAHAVDHAVDDVGTLALAFVDVPASPGLTSGSLSGRHRPGPLPTVLPTPRRAGSDGVGGLREERPAAEPTKRQRPNASH
jgi:hypothetical protein